MSLTKVALLSVAAVVHADNEIAVLQSLRRAYPEWKPRGVVDVGANKGGWTTKLQQLFPNVTTMMIEGSPSHVKQLQETKLKYDGAVDYQVALLSSTDGGIVEFFDNPDANTGNSMFQENTKYFKDVKPQTRTTSKLDTLVSHMGSIDYVKLDVQGAELLVLSGAEETLKKITFVQLEISIIEYNNGGACWSEINSFLQERGFNLYDIGEINRNWALFNTKGVGQLDLLYIRPDSDFLPQWLLEHKVQFCGSSRKATEPSGYKSIAAGENFHFAILGLVAFGVGYILGRRKDKSGLKEN
jgi:FkbM family methyltransferase